MYYKNWKTVGNNPSYHTESENPILKKDEHHAEIIDITDGLVVEDSLFVVPEYNLDNHDIMNQNTIWKALGYSSTKKNNNLNEKYI